MQSQNNHDFILNEAVHLFWILFEILSQIIIKNNNNI